MILHVFYYDMGRLKMLDRVPARLHTIKGQYLFFLGRYPKPILFFQVVREEGVWLNEMKKRCVAEAWIPVLSAGTHV